MRLTSTARARLSLGELVAPAVALLIAVLLLWQFGGLALLGYDSYPLIESSRIQSVGDLVGTFTERLMDERYAGRFYRPLLNVTFALDYAVWGLRPFGYHLTGVLIFLGCLLSVHALMRRLLGGSAGGGPLVAMLLLGLHPLVVEVLPVPARRPEMLFSMFMALALWSALSPRRLSRPWSGVWPAIFGFLAMQSKETGLLTPGLIAVALVLCLPRAAWKVWLGRFGLHLAPHAVALGLAVAMRVAVLGDLGGHTQPETSKGLGETVDVFSWAVGRILAPQPVMSASGIGWLLMSLGVVLALVGFLAIARMDAPRPAAPVADTDGAAPRPPGIWRAAVIGLAWIVCVAVAVSMSGRREVWYLLPPVFGYAMVGGAIWSGLMAVLRRPEKPLRGLGAVAAALMGVLMVWQAWYSPALRPYRELQTGSVALVEFLDQLRLLIEDSRPGQAVNAPPLPAWVQPDPARPTVYGAALLWRYSIDAWAELVMPDRRVRVGGAGDRPAPDEILVRLTTAREGFAPP
jgi:hypothetical protein